MDNDDDDNERKGEKCLYSLSLSLCVCVCVCVCVCLSWKVTKVRTKNITRKKNGVSPSWMEQRSQGERSALRC